MDYFHSSSFLASKVIQLSVPAWGHVEIPLLCLEDNIGRCYTKDALSVWTNLGKHFVVRLSYVSLV